MLGDKLSLGFPLKVFPLDHGPLQLGDILEGFIKKYVQCYSCGNPETQIKIKKENITLKCKACGAVSEVDPRHKLNGFILKNPPENKMSKEEKRQGGQHPRN